MDLFFLYADIVMNIDSITYEYYSHWTGVEMTPEKQGTVFNHGIILGSKLVSATDAPDMQESVQEIGINTLKDYRGKGYARAACISLINELLSRNICPLWSTGENNIAPDRLAKSIGFEKLAGILTINIPE
jgi:predicted GNAT family acetyltransferase